MRRICLVLVLGSLCCVIPPAQATEDAPAETEAPCDTESGESCSDEGEEVSEEEELERGFDPCLINSALPACKPEGRDSGAAGRAPPQSKETEDSG